MNKDNFMKKGAKIGKIRQIPGPCSKKLIELWHKFEIKSTGFQLPVVWDNAKGVIVEDVDGNSYIDWTSGVLVTNVGHCHPRLVNAIKVSSEKLLNNYDCPNTYRIKAAQKLVSALPKNLNKCFFLTTGSETTEAAIRIMKRKTGNFEIISFYGGFHGRTYGAASIGGLSKPKKGYGPSMPGVIRVPYPYCYRCPFKLNQENCSMLCFDFIEDCIRANSVDSLAGLIVEPYLGAAGFIFPPEGWLKKIERLTREKNIIFTLDEVQSSFGRTGKMWALEWENLKPDIMCIGKGIGSGIPVSCIASRNSITDCLKNGEMSSTMGGNPVSSAAVIAVLEIISKEKLVENTFKMGKIIKNKLDSLKERYDIIGDVRGKGLVIGIEIVKDKKSKEPAPDITQQIIIECARYGLLIGSVGIFGNVLRVAPPLVINEQQIHISVDIIEKVISKFARV